MPRYSTGNPNPRGWYSARLDTVGDGTGSMNAIGNYSDAGLGPTYFRVRADHRELALLGITVKIRDNGVLTAEKYGAIDELPNGVLFHVLDPADNVLWDMTAADAIKSNAAWFDFTTNVVVSDYGAGDNFLTAGFRMPDPEWPLYLPTGHSFGLRFHDDMTGLIRQTMFVFGRYVRAFG